MKLLELCVSAFLLCCSAVVWAAFPVPQNISIQSLNMNYILRWDWDPGPVADSMHNVTFTAQYLPKFKKKKPQRKQDWRSMCELTAEHICDFSSQHLHYLGMWLLRLRAECRSKVSSWVEVEFCPDKDAIIGPPSAVNVTPVKNLLQVVISDPLSITNGSMKEYIPNMYYFIQYWKQSSLQEPYNLTSDNNQVILPDLEGWTWYCVRVKSRENFYQKHSVFSPTYCIQTDGQTPYMKIFFFFLLALVLSFLLLVGFFVCILKVVKVVKSTFFPSVPLPGHIKEYLCDIGTLETPRLLSTEPEQEVYCDKLDLLFPDTAVILEVHLQPETTPQSKRTHSRRSSYDSGIYSSEGLGMMSELLGREIQTEELDETL